MEKKDCKFGASCNRKDCKFLHPKNQPTLKPEKKVEEKVIKLQKQEQKYNGDVMALTKRVSELEKIVAQKKKVVATVRAADLQEAPRNLHINNYALSVLDPAHSELCSIPDDVMLPHMLKSVTTSVNIVIASGILEGMLFLFPGHPGVVLGYHYYKTNAGYVYDVNTGPLVVSQDLSESYDYGRKVSQVMFGQVTTLAAGTYALSGTFNMIAAQATISELGPLSYGNLLGAVNNAIDKAANVPVNEGFTVLSPPMPDLPFVRLNDNIPHNAQVGTVNIADITDNQSDLQYNILGNFYNGAVASSSDAYSVTFNIDINGPSTIQGNYIANLTTTASGVAVMTLFATCYSPFGVPLIKRTINQRQMNVVANTLTIFNVSFDNILTQLNGADSGNFGPTVLSSEGLVSAIKLEIYYVGPAAVNINSAMSLFTSRINVTNGARYGNANNLAIVAYQNISAGSTLSLSAVSNFEVVPNAELRPNVSTKNAYFDPTSLDYVKQLYSRRAELGIAVVFPRSQYEKMLSRFVEYSAMNLHSPSAQAADFGDIIRGIKNIALPALYSIFPEAKTIVGAGTELYNRLRPSVKAASGFVRAADRPDIRVLGAIASASSLPKMTRISNKRTVVEPQRSMLLHDAAGQEIRTDVFVLFPVVQTKSDARGQIYIERVDSYVVVKGNFSHLTNNAEDFVLAGEHKVFGWRDTKTKIQMPFDVTLLPVAPYKSEFQLASGYCVTEHSCELALKIAAMCPGILENLFTGAMEGDLILPVGYIEAKLALAKYLGRALLANDANCVQVETLQEAYAKRSVLMELKRVVIKVPGAVARAHYKTSLLKAGDIEANPGPQTITFMYRGVADSDRASTVSLLFQKLYKKGMEVNETGSSPFIILPGDDTVYTVVQAPNKRTAKTFLIASMYDILQTKNLESITLELQKQAQFEAERRAAEEMKLLSIQAAEENVRAFIAPTQSYIQQLHEIMPRFSAEVNKTGLAVFYDAGLNLKAITFAPDNVICFKDNAVQLSHPKNNVMINNGRKDGADVLFIYVIGMLMNSDNIDLRQCRVKLVSNDNLMQTLCEMLMIAGVDAIVTATLDNNMEPEKKEKSRKFF